MKFFGQNMTANEAAKEFATNVNAEPRKVGKTKHLEGYAIAFQLVGGSRWYGVRTLADYIGWEVVVI